MLINEPNKLIGAKKNVGKEIVFFPNTIISQIALIVNGQYGSLLCLFYIGRLLISLYKSI